MKLTRPSLLSLLCFGVLAAPAIAQGHNTALQSVFKPNDTFSDVWGYLDPATGKEYAILLGQEATYIVDCTNPTNPQLRGTFSRALSGWRKDWWRDARTYGHYLYVVADSGRSTGGNGMQIIDLKNPDQPVFVKNFTVPGHTWGYCHNVSIDLETGMLYAVGTSSGSFVLDVKSNPTNPALVTRYTAQYVHDMQVNDGIAYLAEINRHQLRVLDVSNLPTMTSLATRGLSYCHSAWPTRDNQFCVATTEDDFGLITIYDVSNKSNPTQIATWRTGGSRKTIVHNAFVNDRLAHLSYYSEGYRCVDISDPANPVEVAFYDTSTYTAGFEGAWGCYPYQPSGNVYVSDLQNGLYVLRPKSATEAYGQATPGTGGVAPELHTFGSAYLGNTNFALECENAAAGASAWALIGAARHNISFLGLTLLVDTTIGGMVAMTTNGSGYAKGALPIPVDTNLIGVLVHTQAFVQDAGGSAGFSATAGRTLELFQK